MSCPGKDLYAFIFLRHDMGPRCMPEQEEDQGQGNKMRNHRQYNSGRTRDSFPFRKHPLLISHLAQIFHFPDIKSFPADGEKTSSDAQHSRDCDYVRIPAEILSLRIK